MTYWPSIFALRRQSEGGHTPSSAVLEEALLRVLGASVLSAMPNVRGAAHSLESRPMWLKEEHKLQAEDRAEQGLSCGLALYTLGNKNFDQSLVITPISLR